MTSLSYEAARDEIFTMFMEAWTQGTPPLNGGSLFPVHWMGLEESSAPNADLTYAAVYLSHLPDPRQTLTGGAGTVRYERRGLLTVQLHVPIDDGQALRLGPKLAKIIVDAYEGKHSPSGVWFRNVRIQEIGTASGGLATQRSSERYQINVYAEFIYDEIK